METNPPDHLRSPHREEHRKPVDPMNRITMDPAFAFFDDEYARPRTAEELRTERSFFQRGFGEMVGHFLALRLGVILGSIFLGITLACLAAWLVSGHFVNPLFVFAGYFGVFLHSWTGGWGPITFWPLLFGVFFIYANTDEDATLLTFWRSALAIALTQGLETWLFLS